MNMESKFQNLTRFIIVRVGNKNCISLFPHDVWTIDGIGRPNGNKLRNMNFQQSMIQKTQLQGQKQNKNNFFPLILLLSYAFLSYKNLHFHDTSTENLSVSLVNNQRLQVLSVIRGCEKSGITVSLINFLSHFLSWFAISV